MAAPLQSTCGVSADSDIAEEWKNDAYVGYSICFKTAAETKTLAAGYRGEYRPPCYDDDIHRVYQLYFSATGEDYDCECVRLLAVPA